MTGDADKDAAIQVDACRVACRRAKPWDVEHSGCNILCDIKLHGTQRGLRGHDVDDQGGPCCELDRRLAAEDAAETLRAEVTNTLPHCFRAKDELAEFWHVQLAVALTLPHVEVMVGLDAVWAAPTLRHAHDQGTSTGAIDGHGDALELHTGHARLYIVEQEVL